MEVPQIAHLKVVIQCTVICGLWPITYNHNNKRTTNIWYYTYSWILFALLILFSAFSYLTIYQNFMYDFNIDELSMSIICSCRFSILIARILYLWKENTVNILLQIMKREEQIYNSQDKEIIQLMNTHSKYNFKLNWYYIAIQLGNTLIYLLTFVFKKEAVINPVTNVTFYQNPLPLKFWLPSNSIVHHKIIFGWELFSIILVAHMCFSMDIFFYSALNYILGQLRILKLMLTHFEKYREKTEAQIMCTRSTADIITLQLFILEHQRIICFINDFNRCLRSVVLMDFLQVSFHLAVSTIYILLNMKKENYFALCSGVSYIVLAAGNVAIYYSYGSQITTECYDLATTVYNIKWYNKSKEFKKMLMVVLTRCHKEVGIQIGSLTMMSWDLLVAIFKGAYTFLQFALQT